MQVVVLTLILLALAIAGIAIKMFLKPGGTFTKQCSTNIDPVTGKPRPCACASGVPEDCENSEKKE